jgi:hypothetical protein
VATTALSRSRLPLTTFTEVTEAGVAAATIEEAHDGG